MALTHPTVKIAGQRLHAVADWNADHTISGNTGEIAFNSAGGVLTDSNLFWDNVNKSLGIGTMAPSGIPGVQLNIVNALATGIYGLKIDSPKARIGSFSGTADGNYAEMLFGEGISSGEYGGIIRWTNTYTGGEPGIIQFFNRTKPLALSTSNTFGSNYNLYIDTNGNIGLGGILADSLPVLYAKSDGNVGIGTTAPQGKLHVGDQATNYLKVKADGEVELVGTARVERHEVLGAATLKKGAVAPGEGWTGLYPTLDFANGRDDEASYVVHVPYRRDATTNMTIEIRWMHDTGADAGTVLWKCTYLSAGCTDDPTAAGTEISILTAGNHAADTILCDSMTTDILAANLTADDDLVLKIWRNDSAGGDTLAEDARLISVHVHFIQNKIGQAT